MRTPEWPPFWRELLRQVKRHAGEHATWSTLTTWSHAELLMMVHRADLEIEAPDAHLAWLQLVQLVDQLRAPLSPAPREPGWRYDGIETINLQASQLIAIVRADQAIVIAPLTAQAKSLAYLHLCAQAPRPRRRRTEKPGTPEDEFTGFADLFTDPV